MILENTIDKREFLVVHPLDDVAEQKVETMRLGPMRMTPAVRPLLALRGYLVLMMLLLLYHVLELAGLFGKA